MHSAEKTLRFVNYVRNNEKERRERVKAGERKREREVEK